MNAKHTPGPWRWEQNTASNANHVCIDIYPILESEYDYRGQISYLQSCGHIQGISTDEAISNARLIAAAPDLLSALDALLSACELPGAHCEVEQAIPAARAAIAKATGSEAGQ